VVVAVAQWRMYPNGEREQGERYLSPERNSSPVRTQKWAVRALGSKHVPAVPASGVMGISMQ
jgi:hypothetical protein